MIAHELIIFTKFHEDWTKIVDFFINDKFLNVCGIFLLRLYLILILNIAKHLERICWVFFLSICWAFAWISSEFLRLSLKVHEVALVPQDSSLSSLVHFECASPFFTFNCENISFLPMDSNHNGANIFKKNLR